MSAVPTQEGKAPPATSCKKKDDFIDRIGQIRGMLMTPQMRNKHKIPGAKNDRGESLRPGSAIPDIYTTKQARKGTYTCNTASGLEFSEVEYSPKHVKNRNLQDSEESPQPNLAVRRPSKIRDSRKLNATFCRKRSVSTNPDIDCQLDNQTTGVFPGGQNGRHLSVSTSSFLKAANFDSIGEDLVSSADDSEKTTCSTTKMDIGPSKSSLFRPIQQKSVSSSMQNVSKRNSQLNASRNLSGVNERTRKMLGRLCKSRDSLNHLSQASEEGSVFLRRQSLGATVGLNSSNDEQQIEEENNEDEEESEDESESSKSKEKVMEWLSGQDQTLIREEDDNFNLNSATLTRQNGNQSAQKRVTLQQTKQQISVDESIGDYDRYSFSQSGEAGANRQEDSLLKYMEQLQRRLEQLEEESDRVMSEFESLNKKWALDKERLQIAEQERIILCERNTFLQRQRDVDKHRLQGAIRQYSAATGGTSQLSTDHKLDMDSSITQIETLLMNLGHERGQSQFSTSPNKHFSDQHMGDYLQDLQDELNTTRLSLTMTENRNNFLSQEIASLTIQLKNANRSIEHLRKSRDEQKRAIKQVLEMSSFKMRSEQQSSKQSLYEDSSNVLTQIICSRMSKTDIFVKDLERILAQSEIANTDSQSIIDSITSLIDTYYVTWSNTKGKDTPILSHRRRMSLRKEEEKKTNRKTWTAGLKTQQPADFV